MKIFATEVGRDSKAVRRAVLLLLQAARMRTRHFINARAKRRHFHTATSLRNLSDILGTTRLYAVSHYSFKRINLTSENIR